MPAESATIHLFHTNDFHGHLSEAGADCLRQAVADLQGAPYLLLDAGDAVKAGNIGVNPFGEPILERMSDLGYHAMTMGNREFHVLHAALATKINRARFPVLCANARLKSVPKDATGKANLPTQANVVFPLGGLNVAVFGLTVPMVTARMKAAVLSDFLFDDAISTAKRQVVELRYRADILIALTHIGLPQDRKLAEAVSGIDLIIGGHSHNTLWEPEIVNGIPIVQTGSHAHHYGHCVLHYDREGVRLEYHLHPLQEKASGERK